MGLAGGAGRLLNAWVLGLFSVVGLGGQFWVSSRARTCVSCPACPVDEIVRRTREVAEEQKALTVKEVTAADHQNDWYQIAVGFGGWCWWLVCRVGGWIAKIVKGLFCRRHGVGRPRGRRKRQGHGDSSGSSSSPASEEIAAARSRARAVR